MSEASQQVVHYTVETAGRRFTTTREGAIPSAVLVDERHHDPQLLPVATERIRAVGEAEVEVDLVGPEEQQWRDPAATVDLVAVLTQLGSGGWTEIGAARSYDPDLRLVPVSAHQAIWLRSLAVEPRCPHQLHALDGPTARAAMRDVADAYYRAPRAQSGESGEQGEQER